MISLTGGKSFIENLNTLNGGSSDFLICSEDTFQFSNWKI